MVTYQAPPDILRSAGDLDVLAMAGDTILMVECKSGRLIRERGDLERIVDKKEGLRKLFEGTQAGARRYVSWLVFNPFANDESALNEALAGSGIVLVRPDQIRHGVIDVFGANGSSSSIASTPQPVRPLADVAIATVFSGPFQARAAGSDAIQGSGGGGAGRRRSP